jgi:hypothetical protein
MINPDVGGGFWLGKVHIRRDPTTSVAVCSDELPACNATAFGADSNALPLA